MPLLHYYIDEAGDTTFYGGGKTVILGNEGVSSVFGMTIVRFKLRPHKVREEIVALQREVENDLLLNTIPSVRKRIQKGGFFFHACKDSDDVKSVFLRFLRDLDCQAETIIARKTASRFIHKHHGKENEFYADVLSHLIKDHLSLPNRVVLNIAERGSSTRTNVLDIAKTKALALSNGISEAGPPDVVFNVQTPLSEPLLTVADYFGWAVQRIFEKGQTRWYDYLNQRIIQVVDIYDGENIPEEKNVYNSEHPLTAKNKIGLQST